MLKIHCMGFSIFSDNIEKMDINTRNGQLLVTISPNSYGISTKDPNFRKALFKSDFLVLDGVYFALASIMLRGKNIQKNQGSDVFHHFMNRMNAKNGKVFFLGASTQTLEEMKTKAAKDYPNVEVGYYSPPYKSEFNKDDTDRMIEMVNNFGPHVLFVGMTCPKQEKWSFENKDRLNTKLICCIGAVFDWYAGNEKTIAPIWWKLRLGWLIRTIHRPEILKRYPNIGIFFWHLSLAIIGNKKYKYGQF